MGSNCNHDAIDIIQTTHGIIHRTDSTHTHQRSHSKWISISPVTWIYTRIQTPPILSQVFHIVESNSDEC